jgi:hypothetical protein
VLGSNEGSGEDPWRSFTAAERSLDSLAGFLHSERRRISPHGSSGDDGQAGQVYSAATGVFQGVRTRCSVPMSRCSRA